MKGWEMQAEAEQQRKGKGGRGYVVQKAVVNQATQRAALLLADSSCLLVSIAEKTSVVPLTVPAPCSDACFLRLQAHGTGVSPSPFKLGESLAKNQGRKELFVVTARPAQGGSCTDLRAWSIAEDPAFATADIELENERTSEQQQNSSTSRAFARLDAPHGLAVKLAASINVLVVYSSSAGKFWVLAGKSVDGSSKKHLLLMKCAVIQCHGPVYSIHVSSLHLFLGESDGVRVWSLRPLIKPDRSESSKTFNDDLENSTGVKKQARKGLFTPGETDAGATQRKPMPAPIDHAARIASGIFWTLSELKDVLTKDSTSENSSAEDKKTKDSTSENSSAEDKKTKDSTSENSSAEDKKTKDSTSENSSAEDKKTKDSTSENSSAEDKKTKDSTSEKSSAEDKKTKDSTSENSSAEDKKTKDSTSENSSAEDKKTMESGGEGVSKGDDAPPTDHGSVPTEEVVKPSEEPHRDIVTEADDHPSKTAPRPRTESSKKVGNKVQLKTRLEPPGMWFVGLTDKAGDGPPQLQVVDIQGLSLWEYVILDSRGGLHLLTLPEASVERKVEVELLSPTLWHFQVTTHVTSFAVLPLPPPLPRGHRDFVSGAKGTAKRKLWISDGMYSVYSVILPEMKTTTVDSPPTQATLAVSQAVFMKDRVDGLVPASPDTVLVLMRGKLVSYVMP